MSEGKRSLPEVLHDAWLIALGEGEAPGTHGGRVQTVVARLQSLLNLTQEEGANLISDLTQRVRKNREELEHRLDESVRLAVQRVGTPLQAEVAALRGRVEALGAKLERAGALVRARAAGTPSAESPATDGATRR